MAKTPGSERRRSLRELVLARRVPKGELITPSFLDGQTVEVCIMTVGERRDLMAQAKNDQGEADPAEIEALVVIHTACIPGTRERLFTLGDKDALIEMAATELDELAEPALRINGMAKGGVPDLETARKNSSATPSEPLITASPNGSA